MSQIASIIIGRNEGDRLKACLASIPEGHGAVVYVDSGSTDGSVVYAKAAGAHVVELDTSIPFTAARARNAGVAAISGEHEYLQFVDGDCILAPGWMQAASNFLDSHHRAGVVCGRRREKFPEASVYNRLCDHEWNTPVGQTKACGGDAMMRTKAFAEVDGFNPDLIAGEEPDICVRLRAAGWTIWRLDAEMTLHDAAMYRFSQFWKRSKRSGYAFAEGAARHGAPPERHWVTETRRALVWGGGLPLVIFAASLMVWPWGLGLALIYPTQVLRLALREGGSKFAWQKSVLLLVGKTPEALGVLSYWMGHLSAKRRGIIEYK